MTRMNTIQNALAAAARKSVADDLASCKLREVCSDALRAYVAFPEAGDPATPSAMKLRSSVLPLSPVRVRAMGRGRKRYRKRKGRHECQATPQVQQPSYQADAVL